jgi:polyferredoxin
METLQKQRLFTKISFFALFIFAPLLDIVRLDLNLGHFIFFGNEWKLNINHLAQNGISSLDLSFNLFLKVFLPAFSIIGIGIFVAWKYGRLYCGWLCPHFSVVEMINAVMRRASGKPSIWENKVLPEKLPSGKIIKPNKIYWLLTAFTVFLFALTWSVSLLTYLLTPAEIYYNLLHFSLTRNQTIFITAATIIFIIEFTVARHLFCRFGCAVGLFQSLAWMANKKAMVLNFDKSRAKLCTDCNSACDNACPMRLKPRSIKRKIFTCTQCAECISACNQVQKNNPDGTLIKWNLGEK